MLKHEYFLRNCLHDKFELEVLLSSYCNNTSLWSLTFSLTSNVHVIISLFNPGESWPINCIAKRCFTLYMPWHLNSYKLTVKYLEGNWKWIYVKSWMIWFFDYLCSPQDMTQTFITIQKWETCLFPPENLESKSSTVTILEIPQACIPL